MSETNSPRPCRWRSSSRRNTEAPTPQASFGIGTLPGDNDVDIGDRGGTVPAAASAGIVAGDAVADFKFRACTVIANQNSARRTRFSVWKATVGDGAFVIHLELFEVT